MFDLMTAFAEELTERFVSFDCEYEEMDAKNKTKNAMIEYEQNKFTPYFTSSFKNVFS